MYLCPCFEIFQGIGNDVRIGKRLGWLSDKMVAKGTSIINSCCENNTERMAAYRLINNKKLTMEEMVEYLAKGCSKGCSDLSHVLCIQDTTEVVFRHSGRLSVKDRDFGYGTSELDQYCIFAHPCMVVDADSRMPVGFSHIKVWSRDRTQGRKKATQRSLLKLEQKESFRWAEAASESAAALPKKVRKTMVGDRESDIYSVMCKDLAAGCDFLIRSIHDRPVDCDVEDGRLGMKEYMESLPVSYTYDLYLRGHKGRSSRTARMTLRYAKVTIHKRRKCLDDVPEELTCYCVYAMEDPSSVPASEAPIEWRLLTSHVVDTVEHAVQCVEWYKCRWFVEELFRVSKSEGFRIESVQLESGSAVKKLIVLTMYAALRCVTLKRAYDEQDERVPTSRLFDETERELLEVEMERIHRHSPKALDGRNPFREHSLAWAAWIIARLGGWSGYVKAHGKPGYITMKIGLDRFNQHLEIIAFARSKNVYKE